MDTDSTVDVTIDEYMSVEREYIREVSVINRQRQTVLTRLIDEVDKDILGLETALNQLKGEEHSNALLQQMGVLQTKIKQLTLQHDKLSRKRACVLVEEDELKQQFGLIWATPRVRRAWVENGRLHYRTLPLYGKDHGNEWRRIGRFEISFDLTEPIRENFAWTNLDGKIEGMHGPPNIRETVEIEYGIVTCAGGMAQGIINVACQTNDYPTLVAFSVRYPECAGSDGNDTMRKWPRVPVEEVPAWYIEEFGP